MRKRIFIVTPNVDHLVRLRKDTQFREAYGRAALRLADGMPLLWASRLLGTPLKEKISGSDLFLKLCGRAAAKGMRVFLLGGRPDAAARAGEALRRKFPALEIAGTYCPPYGFEGDAGENRKIVRLIKEAKPDILFVGLGAPKQEKWICRHNRACGVPVSIGIGCSFEFTAGLVRRAPVWMQGCGLEWFWRLLMEPGRLWKRYLVDDMLFLRLVAEQYFKKISTAKNGGWN